MIHIVYLQDGVLKQGSRPDKVPEGIEYWNVNATEKEFMDTNREYRGAWTWTPDRPADGVGQ